MKLPFGLPRSTRLLDPSMPVGSTANFTPVAPPAGVPAAAQLSNVTNDFGWEYVWHCHLLGHEENDMMRPIVFDVPSTVPTAPVLSAATTNGVKLTWTDPTPYNYATGLPASTLGNPMNEIGFRIMRGTGTAGALTQIGTALANQTTFTDRTAVGGTVYQYQVVVYNAAGSTPSTTLRVTAPRVAITTTSLPAGEVSVAYSQTLAAASGLTPYTWSVSAGALPGGLTLNAATGVISGTPTNAAAFNFTVRVMDSAGATATRALSILIVPGPTITTASLPNGATNSAYSQALAATGGFAPYTWSVSVGSLPNGLTLNASTGVISGTPTNAGVFTFTMQVQDTNLVKATRALSITVSVPQAPIALVQQVSTTTTGARTLAGTLPATVTAGNLIVVSASGWGGLPAAAPVTDNLGNRYTAAGTRRNTSGSSWSVIYYASNAIAGATTVTFTTAATGTQISMVVAEFSNVAAAAPLDVATGATGTGTAPASGNMTPTVTGDLAIGAGTHDVTTTTTAGTGFTLVAPPQEDGNTHQPLAMEYQVLTGTAAVNARFTIANSAPWAQCGALFKHK
jgi:hypothetical protein